MGIGADIPRRDGQDKLMGLARYVDDLPIADVWHAGTIRSHCARGIIKGIHFDPAINWNEYAIVDHSDIPGPNEVLFIERDQPALVGSEIRHSQEPILLLAHRSPSALRRGLRSICVDVEPLPAVLDMNQSLTPELVQYGSDNVFKHIDVMKGDVDAAFAEAAHVIERVYRTGAQEHVYLENQGVVAYPENGVMVVAGSMQCPYYVLASLKHLFARPDEAFRIVQTPTGGGFGGKEDYPSIIAIHAALLSEKVGAPVKLVYDRHEDMAATTKRHPSWVRHRTAVDQDGRLLAMDIEVRLDGGAYVTLSPVVLSRGVIHAAGPYYCENIRIHGEARLTNTPPNGAFRGFGAPQTLFAIERHMNVIARELRLDPVEIRKLNLLRTGQSMATQQIMGDRVDLSGLLERALELSDYRQSATAYIQENAKHPYLKKGVGFSTFYHGAGFTGSGESYLASEVWVEGHADGRVEVLTASTDMGQGTTTIVAQIAADALRVDESQVDVAVPDTSRVPNSGPTVASRTAMVVGKLIEQACLDLRSRVDADSHENLASAIAGWHEDHPGERLLGKAKYKKPSHIQWDDQKYIGDAYGCYGWAAHVAKVEVDLRTYDVKVKDYVALQEVGRVIHPTLARGQIQGGVVQGIGWALTEEVLTHEGAMKNNQMTNYIIPASGDLPPIRVYFEESPSELGPGGAKGIGELPMDGPAPAIVNAVCDALGIEANHIPLTPERLMDFVDPVIAVGASG